ncbi:uncharacterized protein si:ch1073-15f19.2 isoform X2 [Girardinichthys multiradiatus]|uniref:uncharacterized protein si:ch1073-15f19.2 isoform X2 n=1 Tax=Girardinichthys multiradiatus TaxID=208333 RepID=UPI001FAE1E4D|nr:uncharacterized protein si:ch1073-15f19.2 isoform X2 [Girardinichthys multiradiatus]
MAESVLGIAFSLLLLASIIRGAKNSELFVNETLEAEVGENITMPCLLKNAIYHKIIQIKWIKNGRTSLAVYNPIHGHFQYWPNFTIQVKRDDENHLMGSYLHLPWVNKWDSGKYSCEILTFVSGSFTNETKLTVRDEIKLLCNANSVFEVHFGDNATIQCTVNSNAQYRWTKNNKLVSEIEYLELWQVTEAYAGVYELTVNTGNKRLHKEFLISVQTTTTSLRTGPTKSTQGPTDSPHTNAAISLTPTVSTDIQWPTQPNSSTVIVPAEGHITPSTTQSIASHLHSSSMPSNDTTELTSAQRTASDETKNESSINRLYTEAKVSISTEEFRTTQNILERTGHPRTVPTARATVIQPDGVIHCWCPSPFFCCY